jgi:hypothetical protein
VIELCQEKITPEKFALIGVWKLLVLNRMPLQMPRHGGFLDAVVGTLQLCTLPFLGTCLS